MRQMALFHELARYRIIEDDVTNCWRVQRWDGTRWSEDVGEDYVGEFNTRAGALSWLIVTRRIMRKSELVGV